jgi:hypothetical protein
VLTGHALPKLLAKTECNYACQYGVNDPVNSNAVIIQIRSKIALAIRAKYPWVAICTVRLAEGLLDDRCD